VISKDARRFVFDWTVWNKEISEIVNRLVRALESSKSILDRDTGFISPKMVRKLSCCCLVETKNPKRRTLRPPSNIGRTTGGEKMTERSRSYREELLESLRDSTEAAEYLQAALEDSQGAFLVALKNVLDAHKVAVVARASNVSREHIYQMLTKEGNPTLHTLEKILHTLGLRLSIGLHACEDEEQEKVDQTTWHGSWHISTTSMPKRTLYEIEFTDHLPSRESAPRRRKQTANSISAASHFQSPRRAFFADPECGYEMAF
jgi:probable addiction module antidote protein